jgi:hypothetical protein
MGGGGQRQSNYEALRLLCMLMVLNLHSFAGYTNGNGLWQAFDFFRESTSICAVDCFLLISGYFGIKWKFKSFFNLVFQILFYSVGIYLVCVWMGITEWSLREFLVRFLCLYRNSWGFVVGYMILYFCAPLLNTFSQKVTSHELLVFIVVLFAATNFICLSVESNRIFTYSLLYLIGRYLKKTDAPNSLKISASKAYWITTVVIFGLVYFVLFKGLKIISAETITTLPVGFLGFSYSAPFVILQAVFLFLVFSRLNFTSKFVNWCAASSFAIFLIHMHPTIKKIGYYSYTRSLYQLDVAQHIVVLILLIATVFILSILIDKVRIFVSNLCLRLVLFIRSRLPQKWFMIDTYIPQSLIAINNE